MDIKKIAAILTVCSLVMSMPVFNVFAADAFKTETVSDNENDTDTDEEETEETPEEAPPPEEESAVQQEPYEILDPTVMPEGGARDGVTYAAWDGIVEHLFFHPVVAYPELAFDGDAQANGIDDYMVTVGEYNKILQSVYENNYVLVDITDVWSETT